MENLGSEEELVFGTAWDCGMAVKIILVAGMFAAGVHEREFAA